MAFGMGVPKTFSAPRRETRVPMEVGVHITGHPALPGTETTFTENVSPRGARVLSVRRWKQNDQLTIATVTGSFCALARVAYCQLVPEEGFAVGLEFIEPNGQWVVAESAFS
ncbi:MAG: hypothetical protein WB007_17875 [Candidatus Acidiferrales bacterium]